MHIEDVEVIELGSVSADTRGLLVGVAESEFGFMHPGGFAED